MELEQIAKAIQRAHHLREESWCDKLHYYARDFDGCFEQACVEQRLPAAVAELLLLANHWYNDLQIWAEETLNQQCPHEVYGHCGQPQCEKCGFKTEKVGSA